MRKDFYTFAIARAIAGRNVLVKSDITVQNNIYYIDDNSVKYCISYNFFVLG